MRLSKIFLGLQRGEGQNTSMQHHVYFWIKEEHKNAETLAAFEKGLETMTNVVHTASGGWGKPAKTLVRPVSDNTFDYALYITFDSLEKHDAYQVDPDHDVFVDSFKEIWENVRVSDVE